MQDADDQARFPGETPKQRINRELIELLNEIRIALPGVQVLFAFLLVVPFGPGWRHTTGFQRHAYVFSIVTAALATVIMIAPSSYHRLLWRQPHKEHMLMTSNVLLIAGMAFLAMAISGSLLFVVSFALGTWEAAVTTAGILVVILVLWYAMPLARRNEVWRGHD
jgi:amino acid transporter